MIENMEPFENEGTTESVVDDNSSGNGDDRKREFNPLVFLLNLMDNTMAIGVIMLVVGLTIGLLIGYVVWPVEWVDASVDYLREDLRQEWVLMTVDSYASSSDADTALRRLGELGDLAPVTMDAVAANSPHEGIVIFIDELHGLYDAKIAATAEEAAAGGFSTSTLLLVACGVTFLLAGALVVIFIFRRGTKKPLTKTAAMRANEISQQAQQTDYAAMGEDPPVAQWMTTYLAGDDLFDDSFSIDSQAGEFLGECGVGIADTIGVGEPKRVSAFEVWLFDKNDIQTVTKVIMSEHLFTDEVSLNRLAAKGEPVLATPGAQVALDTETLQMVVRVVDLAHGDGAMPQNSFFERAVIELAVWSK